MNLKDEPYLVEIVKDAVSFVSMDVARDLARCHPPKKSQLSLEFVLPDGVHNTRGWARDPRNAECVPPLSVGPESCLQCVLCWTAMQYMLFTSGSGTWLTSPGQCAA